MHDPLARLWRDIQAAPLVEPDPEAIAAATAIEIATAREANPNTIAKARTGLHYLRWEQLGSLARRKMLEG